MPTWLGKWKGGRFYRDRDDRLRFVIEKMRQGRRYAITLPASVADPDAELALFRRDPAGYELRNAETGLRPEDAVVMDVTTLTAFGKHLRAEVTSADYVKGVLGYLTQWANALRGADLRTLRVGKLEELLDQWETARRYRIVALQSFCTWLVGRQRLPLGHAAALLKAPKAKSARAQGKRAYSVAQVEQWYAAMPSQRVRDCLCLGAKYGMHQTEVARIARGEVEIEEHPGVIAAVLTFRHKSGLDHRQAVDAQALAAVRRLMALGRAPSRTVMAKWTERVARRSGLAPVQPKFLRHFSYTLGRKAGRKVTLEGQGGLTRAEMGALLGHSSAEMGRKHYDDSVEMLVLPLTLHHPEDPVQVDRNERRVPAAG